MSTRCLISANSIENVDISDINWWNFIPKLCIDWPTGVMNMNNNSCPRMELWYTPAEYWAVVEQQPLTYWGQPVRYFNHWIVIPVRPNTCSARSRSKLMSSMMQNLWQQHGCAFTGSFHQNIIHHFHHDRLSQMYRTVWWRKITLFG